MSQENVELVTAAYSAVTRRDLNGFLALVHPEVEFRSRISEMEGGVYSGHAGVREWWDTVVVGLDMNIEVGSVETFRDRGIVCMRAIGSVESVEVPARQWQAWRVRDGMISWWDVFRTEAEALEAVGLSE